MNENSNSGTIFWVVLLIIIIAVGAYLIWGTGPTTSPAGSGQATTTTSTTGSTQTLMTGGLSIPYDPSVFSLAAAPEPIADQSYIPPCDQGYQYCFYMASSTYPDSNFETAGISVNARPDLTTASSCMNTEPAGYTNLTPTTSTGSGYSVSAFAPLGAAAAGHFATGALYRLYFGTTCYEFQTRIGQSDYENYPAGSIQQFTDADEAAVATELQNFLDNITLSSTGAGINFPSVSITTTTSS